MIVDALKVFITVIEQKSFSRAADVLYLSQPSISLHIRNLENEFGTKLLYRSPKIKLTKAGQILYTRAKQIGQLYTEAKMAINELTSEVSGPLKIGASFTIGEYLLPRWLAEFAGEYPQIEIEVRIANTEEIAQALRARQLDVGLVEGNVNYTDLIIEPFMQDQMILIAPNDHPFIQLGQLTTTSLQDQVWVLRESGSGTRAFSDRLIAGSGLRVKHAYVFSSSQGVKEAVQAGLGLAVVSRWITRRELAAGELTELPLQGQELTRDFSVVRIKDAPQLKVVDIFIAKLLSYALT